MLFRLLLFGTYKIKSKSERRISDIFIRLRRQFYGFEIPGQYLMVDSNDVVLLVNVVRHGR